ncbi:unnamed protein product [Caenorhabditis nigoni]
MSTILYMPPTLDSLPNELIDKISQKLGPIDKLCLRNASKRIREVVDRTIIQFTYLRLAIRENFVEISLNYDNPVTFFRYQHNRCLVFNRPRPRKLLIGNCFLIALKVWNAILSIKSLRVRLVYYDISKEKVDISRVMRRIQPSSIFADNIYIHAENYGQVPELLAQFKTELIETMKLSVYNKTGDKRLDGIFQMEKFKNLDELNMLGLGLIRAADLKWLTGFPMFFVNLVSIRVNDLILLKNVLLRPSHEHVFWILSRKTQAFDHREIIQMCRALCPDQPPSFTCICSCPRSNLTVKFEFHRNTIVISR